MENLQVAELALKKLKSLGADQALVQVSNTVSKELNIEANRFTLLRTTFDQDLSVRSCIGQKMAKASGNQFSEDKISELCNETIASTKAGSEDIGNGFAKGEGTKKFTESPRAKTADDEDSWMYEQLNKLLKSIRTDLPKTILEGATLKLVKSNRSLIGSNDINFQSQNSYYDGFAMFTTKDGKKSSSFNYAGFQLPLSICDNSSFQLYRTNGLNELLKQSSEQIEVRKIPQKFEGDIIVTPHCLQDLTGGLLGYLKGDRMLKKTSPYFGKLGEKVISDKISLESLPRGNHFASQSYWTADGYLTENESIFQKGILKSYLMNHYTATKISEKASRSGGVYLKMNSGDIELQKLIGSVKKGLLLCRYSSGYPSESGDISGVAKNSYYIENGEILYPVSEAMVSGNLFRMFQQVEGASKETLNSGYCEFPWLRMTGVVVS